MNQSTERQQLLFLWTANSALDSQVVGWTFHDGNDLTADITERPYRLGAEALADGWRLIQASPLVTRAAGDEHAQGVLEFEWLFERIVPHSTRDRTQ